MHVKLRFAQFFLLWSVYVVTTILYDKTIFFGGKWLDYIFSFVFYLCPGVLYFYRVSVTCLSDLYHSCCALRNADIPITNF